MRSRTTASSSRAALVLAALLAAACASAASAPRHGAGRARGPRARRRRPRRRAASNGHLRAGIVSVRVTGQDWNWRAPWEKQAPWTRTVTGPRRARAAGSSLASTAFGNHLLVEAQKLGSEARTVARVELVDHEGPLALVAVDDPAFWEGLEPLPLAERAPGEGDVTILRWQRSGPPRRVPGHGAPGALRAARPLADEPADPRDRRAAPTASASRRSSSRRGEWPASSPAGPATPTAPSPRPC